MYYHRIILPKILISSGIKPLQVIIFSLLVILIIHEVSDSIINKISSLDSLA
jgi:hypothetical protein